MTATRVSRRTARKRATARPRRQLEKCPTGITGFDEVTAGGLPRGRPTLLCGGPGCGKTIFSLEFLLRGAIQYGEPGVLLSFEESAEDIAKNVASLGFELDALVARKRIVVDHVRVERSEIEETGEYDLDGLFIRLGHAIDSIGAKRVVLDTIESLFSGLSNGSILRSELRRLFGWLKERGVTAIITGERGDGQLTRQGLEEYVSDCVVLLDHRVVNGISTRRLRVVKYRGSTHGTNEYPFLIDADGVSVMPITSTTLTHAVSDERISSGIPRLDTMLGGAGYYRGSSVLVSGTAGSGKSSIAAHLALSAGRRRERALYFAFEESEQQIVRNMRSIGVDLRPSLASGLLRVHATRPSLHGLETHLATMHKLIDQFEPSVVIVDPITNLTQAGSDDEASATLLRLIDFLKARQITSLYTSLTEGGGDAEATDMGVSSLMDTWLLLRNLESRGERNRGLYVLKSRGMAHSNQVREFVLTSKGINLVDVYTGPEGILAGSGRIAQEASEAAAEAERRAELETRKRQFERRRAATAAQISVLEADLDAEAAEIERAAAAEDGRRAASGSLRRQLGVRRGADKRADNGQSGKRVGRNSGGHPRS